MILYQILLLLIGKNTGGIFLPQVMIVKLLDRLLQNLLFLTTTTITTAAAKTKTKTKKRQNKSNKNNRNGSTSCRSNCSSSSSSSSNIHFIGISVGGFAANAAATEVYRQQQKRIIDGVDVDVDVDIDIDIDINLTLLDPFCGRGIFQPNYGRDYFGKYATTAVQILNTDDPVPTTNEPLPFCYCLDVTKSLKRDNFIPLQGDSMHSWPLAYYIRHYYNTYSSKSNKNEDGNNFSRGMVIKIP
jgi:hypothetical protein